MNKKIICLVCMVWLFVNAYSENLSNTNSSTWKNVQPWKNIKVPVVVLKQVGQLPSGNNISTNIIIKAGGYQEASKPDYGTLIVTAVYEPTKHKTIVFPYGGEFFIRDDLDSDIIAYALDSSLSLRWESSCIEVLNSNGSMEKAIQQFEKQFDTREKVDALFYKNWANAIDLYPGLPKEYYDAESRILDSKSRQSFELKFKSVCAENGNLRLDVQNEKSKTIVTFWIDLKAKKVVRSVVDGVEMDVNTGKGYAVPMVKK